jgi:hypothetical protein
MPRQGSFQRVNGKTKEAAGLCGNGPAAWAPATQGGLSQRGGHDDPVEVRGIAGRVRELDRVAPGDQRQGDRQRAAALKLPNTS